MPTSRPRGRAARLTALVSLAGLVAVGSPVPAQAADSWQVPSSATVVVKGHGFGHGRGLSQYGAEGAAREGLGFAEIAEFYYPGTTWARARGPIRVLLTADTTDDLVVLARPGLRLLDRAAGESVELPDNGATRWRTTVTRAGRTRVAYLTDTWRRWRRVEGEASFTAPRSTVTLVTPAGERSYRGRLTAVATAPGSRDRATVNTLKLEQYLRGVVPLEIPASWSPEAVRAQAVAARTYAAHERAHPDSSYHDLCDTTSCQVYGGADAEHPGADGAVAATRRQVLHHDGAPAFTQFSASSGGWTAVGSTPYLVAREDPYDGWAGNPHHDWRLKLTDRTFEAAWPVLGDLQRIRVKERSGGGEWGGRVATLRLVGSHGAVTVTGDTMRSALGLRSTWVTFRVR